jgi:hypothetical protein
MKIKLDDKHYLNSDEYCYWITVEVITQDGKNAGKPYEKRCSGYTATFEQAVDSFIEKKIKASQIEDFKKLVKTIKDLKKEVRGWKSVVEKKK